MIRKPLSRRALLKGIGKGVGVSIALPFLEAMLPRTITGALAAAEDAAPLTAEAALNRLLILYIPNGVHIPNWYPETEGADYKMSPTLEPLAQHQKDFLILNN